MKTKKSLNLVHQLRTKGYKVRVHHTRIKLPRLRAIAEIVHGGGGAVISHGEWRKLWEENPAISIPARELYELSSKGGNSFVEITTPDNRQLSGSGECSVKDNFDRKRGLFIAIRRAFKEGGNEEDKQLLNSIIKNS